MGKSINNDVLLNNTQYKMHKNFFDRAQDAIDNKFYLEAIFLEYAAIEGRLEIILGVLGCPCNKDIDPSKRKDIQISHRIKCLNEIMKSKDYPDKSKLDKKFFKVFNDWRVLRNTYIHGLYKNSMEYVNRTENAKEIAESGLKIAKSLYNEASRLKRLLNKNHSQYLDVNSKKCYEKKCSLNADKDV